MIFLGRSFSLLVLLGFLYWVPVAAQLPSLTSLFTSALFSHIRKKYNEPINKENGKNNTYYTKGNVALIAAVATAGVGFLGLRYIFWKQQRSSASNNDLKAKKSNNYCQFLGCWQLNECLLHRKNSDGGLS